MRARAAGRIAALAASTAVVVAAWAGPAGAAKPPNPCKVLKASEIFDAFVGATVASLEPGLKTLVSASCDFDVEAGTTIPAGTVSVSVMSVGAKPAYDGMKKMDGFAAVPGIKSSVYQEATGALSVLDGDTLVTVQGVFLTDTLPIERVDVLDQLVPLSKIATKRV